MYRFLFSILLTGLFACHSSSGGQSEKAVTGTAPDSFSSQQQPRSDTGTVPDDDEIQEFGLLKEVEDAGYPFAVLIIEFPERRFSEYFTMNYEEVKGAGLDNVRKWTGKYVSFRYISTLEDALLDVQIEDKSVVDPSTSPDVSKAKKITGVLQGAGEETSGDLPGKISITPAGGPAKPFDFFVTSDLVSANGKIVTGYYEARTKNIIKAIKVSPKK